MDRFTRRDPPRVTLLLALRLAEALSPVGAAAHQAAALAGGGQGEGVRHRHAGGQQEGEEEGHLATSDQTPYKAVKIVHLNLWNIFSHSPLTAPWHGQ